MTAPPGRSGSSLSLRSGVLLFAACFLAQIVLASIAAAILESTDAAGPEEATPPVENPATSILLLLAAQVPIVFFTILFLARRSGESLVRIGLSRTGLFSEIPPALGSYAVFLPVYYFIVCTINARLVDNEQQELVRQISEHPSLLASPFFLAAICLLTPFIEEFFFRGLLYSGLRAFIPVFPAVIGSAAVFALFHGLTAALPIFSLGCLLAFIRERTRTLLPVTVVHGIHNGLTLFLLARL